MGLIAVTGINTDVGKTVVAAILVEALKADYWKPIQSGNLERTDTQTVKNLVSQKASQFHQESYLLKEPLSPHHAARLEGIEVNPKRIERPLTNNLLVIEGVGGLMVPLNERTLMIDLLAGWNPKIILVSKHYLGSINHTLLSVEALKNRKMQIGGIIFNGQPNPDTENVIMEMTGLPVIGRLEHEKNINSETIKRYASLWKQQLVNL
jgi:dethiobiotin synthetase